MLLLGLHFAKEKVAFDEGKLRFYFWEIPLRRLLMSVYGLIYEVDGW
jgi:hypothetical protein